MKIILKIIDNIKYYILKINDCIVKRLVNKPNIKSIEDTIDKIINDKVSVSRYGDGEFKWMCGISQNSFQDNSQEMRMRLIEIIRTSSDKHIVCLPDSFGSLREYNKFARRFWTIFMAKFRLKWISYLDINKDYYNTNISRLYMDYLDKDKCIDRFNKIKMIWKDRDIVIIEGEKSRLGVGNDLFDNSKSVRRILAPSVNAYSKYNEILKKVNEIEKESLILIALGPTATILAYDLSLVGYQAIDIGHIDIEYEWFLMNATKKIPIKDKFTNEASHIGGRNVNEILDSKYTNEIIANIS